MNQLLKSLSPRRIMSSIKKSSSSKSRSMPLSKSEPNSFSSNSRASSSSASSDASAAGHVSGAWSDGDAAVGGLDFAQAFKLIDRDNDGKITRVELASLLRRVGPISDDELAAMIGEIDGDGDGCVTLEELEAVGSALESTVTGEDELREAFDFFDGDHDGRITAEELLEVFLALGDERCTLSDCRRMIAGVDKNGDGFVCFADFARMMDLQR